MSSWNRVVTGLKNFLKRVTHEVPTGPHTDVTRRKINPSFKKKLAKGVPKVVLPKLVNPKSGQKTAPPIKKK